MKFKPLIEELRKYPSTDVYLKQFIIEILTELDKIHENFDKQLKSLEEEVDKVLNK